jgi:hypothetical protein
MDVNAVFPLGRAEAWAGVGARVATVDATVGYRETWNPSLACVVLMGLCPWEWPQEKTLEQSASGAQGTAAVGLRLGGETGFRLGVELRAFTPAALHLGRFDRDVSLGGWSVGATIGWAKRFGPVGD